MVLAAGLGTRLKPLTDLRAKSLVPVGDRPALDHVADRLRAAGIQRIVVNVHHHADQLRAFARGRPGMLLSEEPELLGTAGGLARAHDILGPGDVLVWNADILADIDVPALLAAHGDEGTLVVQPLAPGEGRVGMDERGRVVRLRNQRFGEEVWGGDFLGIHVLGASLRARLPERGGLIEDVYTPALARGDTLRTLPFGGAWHDIGTAKSYLDANMAWLAVRGLTRWVGPGATVAEGVILDCAIVGQGASVAECGALRRCVVWPGAKAAAPLHDQVITA
jgi:mannose-1-phosphate guanylyltransferase